MRQEAIPRNSLEQRGDWHKGEVDDIGLCRHSRKPLAVAACTSISSSLTAHDWETLRGEEEDDDDDKCNEYICKLYSINNVNDDDKVHTSLVKTGVTPLTRFICRSKTLKTSGILSLCSLDFQWKGGSTHVPVNSWSPSLSRWCLSWDGERVEDWSCFTYTTSWPPTLSPVITCVPNFSMNLHLSICLLVFFVF